MGRGDRRTRKGKTWRGTYGKSRPRPSNVESASNEQQEQQKEEKTEKAETKKGKK